MKVSEMIKNLQEFMETYGDIECWYAVDDEGNGYQKIHYEPTLYYINSYNEVYQSIEEIIEDLEIDEEDIEEEGIKTICVVN